MLEEERQQLSAFLLSEIERVPGPLADECWLFRGYRTDYAKINWQGEYQSAHRLSHIAFIGQIKDGHLVCHRCDVRGCINPDHLWQDTHQGNVEDAIAKGRFRFITPRSENSAKLTKVKVSEIKALINAGRSGREIATLYDTSPANVSKIKNEENWPLVEPRIVGQIIRCRWCQTGFIPTRPQQLSCSVQCTVAWHNNQRDDRRKSKQQPARFLRRF